jgi:hypothetical protein
MRIGVVVAFVLAAAGTAVLVPAINDARQQRAAADRREREAMHDRRIRELRAEQRPRFGRAAVAPQTAARAERLAARVAALDAMSAAIATDARRRVRAGALDGPIRRIDCEPFPRTVDGSDPARRLGERRGRYACLAVTSAFEGGAIGHPYRTMIDYETGRYAFCKIAGRTDPTPDPEVTTPRVCGG